MFGTPELEEFRMSRKLRGANSPPKRHRPQTARPRFEGGTRVHIPMAYRNIWCVSMLFCRKHHKRVPQELGGVDAPSNKGPVPLKARPGWFPFGTTPVRPAKVASRHFIYGAATPP